MLRSLALSHCSRAHRSAAPRPAGGCVTRRREASSRGATFVIVAMLFASLATACRSTAGDDEAAPEDVGETLLRLDRGIEPLDRVEALRELYLLPPLESATALHPLRTDRDGRARITHALSGDRCLDVLAHGNEGAALVLRVAPRPSDDASAPRAPGAWGYDRGANGVALVPAICPSEASNVTVELRAAPGTVAALELHERPSDALERGLWARGQADLPGFRPAGPVQEETLAELQRSSFPLQASPTRCLAIVGYSDDELPDLDMQLRSRDGEQLALEVAVGRGAVVGPFCPYAQDVIRAEFRAYQGQGRFLWQVWESPVEAGNVLLDARERSPDGTLPEGTRGAIFRALWSDR